MVALLRAKSPPSESPELEETGEKLKAAGVAGFVISAPAPGEKAEDITELGAT